MATKPVAPLNPLPNQKPSNKRLKLLINARFSAAYNFGWNFILKCQGHQSAHIHPNGWLVG